MNKYIWIALGVGALFILTQKKSSAAPVSALPTSISNCIKISAASKTRLAAARSAGQVQSWREIAADEWPSMCGTFSLGMGYDVCQTKANVPTVLNILAWFKGMNINPVHHQDYALAKNYRSDILKFYQTCPQLYFADIPAGSYING